MGHYRVLKMLRFLKLLLHLFYRNIGIFLYKKLPLFILKFFNFSNIDYFLSGRFNFESFHRHVNVDLLPRIYLTKNEWNSYLGSLHAEIDVLDRNKLITKKIRIAFFCSYADAHFIEHTINHYPKQNINIEWFLCKFSEFDVTNHNAYMSTVIFTNLDSAIQFCDNYIDFVIDADGPLRPTKTMELVKKTKSYVLNYFNLIATSNMSCYDAIIVPSDVNISPLVSEPKIIRLRALGGWHLEPLEHNSTFVSKAYHIGIIAEQFKFGVEFFESFSALSNIFKFVFVGIKYPKYLIFKMKQYGWNLDNIFFENYMQLPIFRKFLKEKVYTILDVPNYSSGSGTIIALSVGLPVICKDGDYWINQMAASIMKETNNNRYIYREIGDIEKIIRLHVRSFSKYEIEIETNVRESSYLNVNSFVNDLYKSLIENFGIKLL